MWVWYFKWTKGTQNAGDQIALHSLLFCSVIAQCESFDHAKLVNEFRYKMLMFIIDSGYKYIISNIVRKLVHMHA